MFIGVTASSNLISDNNNNNNNNKTHTHSFSHFTCFSPIVTFMDLVGRNQAVWKFRTDTFQATDLSNQTVMLTPSPLISVGVFFPHKNFMEFS